MYAESRGSRLRDKAPRAALETARGGTEGRVGTVARWAHLWDPAPIRRELRSCGRGGELQGRGRGGEIARSAAAREKHWRGRSMALRNHLVLGNRAAAPALDCSSFLPGKPTGTRAQRLAIRRSVLLWGARADLDSSASATDLFTETTARAVGSAVKLENRLEKVGLGLGLECAY